MEQITDMTECCICTEMFTDPRMLPCIHSFCLKCLKAIRSKSKKNPGDTMPCPICREQFTIPPDGLSGLRKNFFIERLMEIAKLSKPLKTAVSCDVCLINKDDDDIEVHDASKYCVECQESMCAICSVQHKRQKLSRDHQIVPFESQLKDELMKTSVATYCNQHNKEEVSMYCADCKKVICRMCFAESHQMHKCSDVNKTADAFRDEIGIVQAKVVEASKEGFSRELKLEQEKRKFMEESEIAETAINERVNELKTLIDKHAKVLLDELVQRKATRMKETETKNEEIERYLAIVKSFNAYCSEMKSKGTPTDICCSVHDLRARANELQEVNVPQIELDTSVSRVSFKTSAIEGILKLENIVGSLEEQQESLATHKTDKEQPDQPKSLATLKTNKEQPVSVDCINRLQLPTFDVKAVTRLDEKIYVLAEQVHQVFTRRTMLVRFDDRNPLEGYKKIQIREIHDFEQAVSSEKLKCLYIFDSQRECIWMLTVDDCQVTQWLPNVNDIVSLSVGNDGNLLLLRSDGEERRLDIYASDAKIIRSISLSRDIYLPAHVIQECNGQFLMIHKSQLDPWIGILSWVISELNSEGQILRQFQSREEHQELMNPYHLSLDSENNRLFVAQRDKLKSNVVMFDLGSLKWKQILLTSEENLPKWALHFDERKKQILVGKLQEVAVYQIH